MKYKCGELATILQDVIVGSLKRHGYNSDEIRALQDLIRTYAEVLMRPEDEIVTDHPDRNDLIEQYIALLSVTAA
jgi:hypothetical protein